jgi:hypothetical protein
VWYPIDGSQLPDSPAESPGATNLSLDIKPDDAPPASDLKDWIQSEKDLSVDAGIALGFAPFALDESGNHRTLVLDALRYVDKEKVRSGAGVRFTLDAWTEHADVKGSIALVAAQASLNLVYTKSTFQILGYQSPELAQLLPGFDEMSVSNYANLMKALDAVQAAVMAADPAALTPCPVAVDLVLPPPAARPHHWLVHLHHS